LELPTVLPCARAGLALVRVCRRGLAAAPRAHRRGEAPHADGAAVAADRAAVLPLVRLPGDGRHELGDRYRAPGAAAAPVVAADDRGHRRAVRGTRPPAHRAVVDRPARGGEFLLRAVARPVPVAARLVVLVVLDEPVRGGLDA